MASRRHGGNLNNLALLSKLWHNLRFKLFLLFRVQIGGTIGHVRFQRRGARSKLTRNARRALLIRAGRRRRRREGEQLRAGIDARMKSAG